LPSAGQLNGPGSPGPGGPDIGTPDDLWPLDITRPVRPIARSPRRAPEQDHSGRGFASGSPSDLSATHRHLVDSHRPSDSSSDASSPAPPLSVRRASHHSVVPSNSLQVPSQQTDTQRSLRRYDLVRTRTLHPGQSHLSPLRNIPVRYHRTPAWSYSHGGAGVQAGHRQDLLSLRSPGSWTPPPN